MPETGMFLSNQKGAEIRFYYTFYRFAGVIKKIKKILYIRGRAIFYKIKLQFSMGSSVL